MEQNKIMEKFVRQASQIKEPNIESFIDGVFVKCDKPILKALESSKRSFESWKNNTQRSSILKKVGEFIKSKQNLLLDLATFTAHHYYLILEELNHCSDSFNYYAKWAIKLDTLNSPVESRGPIAATILEDCHIFGALTWLTAAPLAAGNTLVLFVKDNYSAIATCFAVILHDAGIPPGVVNVVPLINENLFPEITNCFENNMGIIPERYSISEFEFCDTNLLIMLKKHSLCPMLVSKSADVDSAVQCLINSTESDEALWFPNIVFVEEACFDIFVQTFKHKIAKFSVYDDKTGYEKHGPRLDDFFESKKKQGFELFQVNNSHTKCIYFLNFDVAIETASVNDGEETYHLISLVPVRTLQEAITALNKYRTALFASVWSNDAVEIVSLPYKLSQCMTVWINSSNVFDSSVPFSIWDTSGFGTVNGKRALYENLRFKPQNIQITTYYPYEKNAVYPKKEVDTVILRTIIAHTAWCKLSYEERAASLEQIAKFMKENWKSQFESSFDKLTEAQWLETIDYLYFWSAYVTDSAFDRILFAHSCRILCHNEPVGIIGILVGNAPMDVVTFLISAGLIFGNAIIVGVATDENTCVVATALETIFGHPVPNLVSVVTGTKNDLRRQFISNENISILWVMKGTSVGYNCYKNVIRIEPSHDMKPMAEFFELCATKQKTVWIPSLVQ